MSGEYLMLCTDGFDIAEYRVCEPLYDTLYCSYVPVRLHAVVRSSPETGTAVRII